MNPKGLLRVQGTIRVSQFWPAGESDADTAKIIVTLDPKRSFLFRESKGKPFKPTRAFIGASVGGKSVITTHKKSGESTVTIRLQGIDAPELHYNPSPLSKQEKSSASGAALAAFKALNKKYRQHWGETCADTLRALLASTKKSELSCTVDTAVDHPGDVFDKYGRLIGDIFVTVKGKKVDINHWLAETGWAFPAFYESMTLPEIDAILKPAQKARENGTGIYPGATNTAGVFDFNLIFRAPKSVGGFHAGEDAGTVIFPKFFRRQCSWATRNRAGITSLTFEGWLRAGQEEYIPLDAFRAAGGDPEVAKPSRRKLADTLQAGVFDHSGFDMIFLEAPANLYKNGKPVTRW
jgi:endonuclease YncB( thermonuclease family)